jgi:hypothetical protein
VAPARHPIASVIAAAEHAVNDTRTPAREKNPTRRSDTSMLNQVPPAALALPSVLLGAGAFLRHVPGEWSRGALLAWAAVLLAYLSGMTTPAGVGAWSAVAGLAIAFAALALGGTIGLGLLAAAFAALAAAAFAGVFLAPPALCLVTAAAAAAAAFRSAG